MIRPPLLSLAPLRDPVVVLRLLHCSAAAVQAAHGPINSYWQSQGLVHRYHTYAATLQEHYISPHQVLLDADIDQFSHPEAGPAERECCLLVLNLVSSTLSCIRQPRPRFRVLDVIMSVAGQFLPEPSSDADESA